MIFYMGMQIVQLRKISHPNRPGDGMHVESYGFDLSNCRIPREEILATRMAKDGISSLQNPETVTVEEIERADRNERYKYLVSSDRIIGVTLQGEARAYPLRVLNWHEIVNDVVGNRPIAVTYSPLCDSAVVYDREVEGQEFTFGVSGLVYNSNPLLFNRTGDGAGESLWSQLLGEALSGKDAGKKLTVIPCSLVSWNGWKTLYPQTTVLKPEASKRKLYSKQYGNYFGSDILHFPVKPALPADGIAKKTPVIIVQSGDRESVYRYETVAKNVNSEGTWITKVGNTSVRFRYENNPPSVQVESLRADEPILVRYAFWFAWYALHPGSQLMP